METVNASNGDPKPGDRNRIPVQFICPGCQWIGPMKDMDLHCPMCNMGMGAIESVSISKQHAASLAAFVAWYRAQLVAGTMSDKEGELTVAYCDELLEDLEQ